MAPSFRLSPAIRDRILDVIWRHLSPVDWDVILFGSFARGTATVASDIDLAVRGRAPLPAAVAARLVADLEDGVPMLREYDVVDLAVAGPALRHRIEAEGETWHRAAART